MAYLCKRPGQPEHKWENHSEDHTSTRSRLLRLVGE